MKQDWKTWKLEEVCEELFAGGDVPKENSSKTITNTLNIPIYTNGENNKGLYGYTNIARVTKPSVTVSARGTIGYSEIREEDFYPAVRLIVATPNTEIIDVYFLKYILSNIKFVFSGVSIPQLTVPMIKGYEILLPPLQEQKRIVSILDKSFAAIDKAKVNAERNLKNSKEIFESYLNYVFEDKKESWRLRKLGDLCEFVRGPFGGSLKKNIFKPKGYAVYEQQHAIYNQFHSIRYFIDEHKFNEMNRFELKTGDLIMSCSGTIGKTAIVPDGVQKGIINQALLKLTPSNDIIVTFLRMWMQSSVFRKSINKNSKGAAIKNVASVKILKGIEILLPPRTEQQALVEKLNILALKTKKLNSIYKKKIDDLDELKKSLLQKAFNGEL